MKNKISSQSAFLNLRISIGLFAVLFTVSLALVGSGAISKGTGGTKESMSSAQTAQPHSKDVTLRDDPRRYVDEKGNRAIEIKTGAALGT